MYSKNYLNDQKKEIVSLLHREISIHCRMDVWYCWWLDNLQLMPDIECSNNQHSPVHTGNRNCNHIKVERYLRGGGGNWITLHVVKKIHELD